MNKVNALLSERGPVNVLGDSKGSRDVSGKSSITAGINTH